MDKAGQGGHKVGRKSAHEGLRGIISVSRGVTSVQKAVFSIDWAAPLLNPNS